MKTRTRIPAIPGSSKFALARWFGRLNAAGLLFHPDDKPENIISIETREPTFTAVECSVLSESLEILFHHHGDLVYDVALSYAQRLMGIKVPASA
jgi:hypothetical protein